MWFPYPRYLGSKVLLAIILGSYAIVDWYYGTEGTNQSALTVQLLYCILSIKSQK